GLRIHLQLPLTLSVIRCLMVEISGEAYAFPLARIDNIIKLNKNEVDTLENLQYFTVQGQHIGLVDASQILGTEQVTNKSDTYEVVIIGDRQKRYGLVINQFFGEHNLVVHALDPRLGKIKDISSASITEDGEPVLIIDVDDMLISIEELVTNKRLHKIKSSGAGTNTDGNGSPRKRVLIVDDSLTVREVERKLLESKGYQVEIAVDGMDGWNTVRTGEYDLVISDVDMPRMNGIEFVSMIKNDPNLKSIPVMIVSYKDRQEDRELGLDAGADYYLTKGSFHDESLIDAVIDLIGEAD
ncbi:MAG: response regulator, partial [Gammaproteobacteria bacterium]|nr:response regulator [Gammaproteobacteria bacterium]